MTESGGFSELLVRARQGDDEALEQLVREYEPQVRVVARARLGVALRPYLDSVDLVQSVHRSVMIGIREKKFDFETPDRLVALALTIVRRKVARHWRRNRRQRRMDPSDSQELPEALVSMTARDADPGSIAALREEAARVLHELDDVERQLIELRLEGCTTAEAARRLGLDADVLRVRLHRLRRRLRDKGFLTDWL